MASTWYNPWGMSILVTDYERLPVNPATGYTWSPDDVAESFSDHVGAAMREAAERWYNEHPGLLEMEPM